MYSTCSQPVVIFDNDTVHTRRAVHVEPLFVTTVITMQKPCDMRRVRLVQYSTYMTRGMSHTRRTACDRNQLFKRGKRAEGR